MASQPTTAYFLAAIDTVRKNKEQYAAAEARARRRHPTRPSYFDMIAASGGFAAMQLPQGFTESFIAVAEGMPSELEDA